jgi:hypothetical protein
MKEKGEAASILLPWRLTWPPFTSPLFPPVNHAFLEAYSTGTKRQSAPLP